MFSLLEYFFQEGWVSKKSFLNFCPKSLCFLSFLDGLAREYIPLQKGLRVSIPKTVFMISDTGLDTLKEQVPVLRMSQACDG